MMLIHKLCNLFCRHRNQINQCKITKEQNIFEQFYSFHIQYNDIQSDNLTKTKYKNTKINAYDPPKAHCPVGKVIATHKNGRLLFDKGIQEMQGQSLEEIFIKEGNRHE